jgi:BCCT, betaine/carnitine/choline family transporter
MSLSPFLDQWILLALSSGIVTSLGLGLFTATISRGRQLGSVIFYGIIAPTACCGLLFTTFGGIGFRQSRQALELDVLGTALFNNSRHFLADGHELCYDVPQEDILIDGEVVFTNGLLGVSPVCQYDAEHTDSAIFKILDSFHFPGGQGMGAILSVVFLFGTALFFVAGSDAATLAVDILSSNGRKNYHWSRRMYWACTPGALASVLLTCDMNVLESLYSMLMVCSLPVAILLCYLTQSVALMCQAANKNGHRVADYEFPDQPEFHFPVYGGVFDVMEFLVSLGKVNSARVDLGMDRATKAQVAEFVKGLCVPFLPLYDVLSVMYPMNQRTNASLVATYSLCYYSWVGFLLAFGMHGMTCMFFVVSGCILGNVRANFRKQHNLRSNSIGDYVAGTFVWPQVIAQMRLQLVSRDNKRSATVPVWSHHGDDDDDDGDDRSIHL